MTKLLNFIFGLTLIVCLLSVGGYIYVQKNADKHVPIITNMFGSNTKVSDEDVKLDPDVKYTWVLNYYKNLDNSGTELLEIKQSTYTDHTLSNVYSMGIQIQNPSAMFFQSVNIRCEYPDLITAVLYNNWSVTHYEYEPCFFDSVDGISFSRVDGLTSHNDELYIIDIDEKPYAFNFGKTTLIYESHAFLANRYYYRVSSFDYFMYQLFEPAKSLSQGIYDKLPMKFTDIFNIYEYNSITGKFDIQSDLAQIDDYVSFKFNIYDRGAMTHDDSIFGMIGTSDVGGVIWGN